jgi:O-antigen ligase
MSRNSRWTALRWAAAGTIPAILVTLYFTYSRGGVLAALFGAAVVIALSGDRLWLLATAAIGALGGLPALLAIQSRDSLAENLATQTSVDQGVEVLLILVAGVALTLGLFALLRRLERRSGPRTGRALQLSRDPKVLRTVAVAAAVLAIASLVVVGSRASDQFSSSDIEFPNQPAQHFSDFNSGGRSDFWRVAIDAFEEKPLFGHGAGTYQLSWDQLRSITLPVIDAHSLYLEPFAELGAAGGLLVLALIGTLLWVGIGAWRAASGSRREAHAALLAAALVFAAAAAIDWFWEIADLAAIFCLAAGALTAARCAQLAPDGAADGAPPRERRFGLAVAGLALAWISAIALVGPLLVEREITASQSAVADGDLVAAVDHADTARSIEPWAASPYLQLGLVAERRNELDVAAERLGQAIEREDHNWELYALRSRVESEAGNPAAARADLREARRLNPLAPQLSGGGE